MAEEAQSRLQNAVDSMVKNLERENIRKMQGKMFRCSAQCCDNEPASMQVVHNCIERCHMPLAQAQSLVTNELERFQDRLSRCTLNCNDKAKDSFDSGNKEAKVRAQLEGCVMKCAEEHMNLIPSMTKKLKDSLIEADKKTS
ncbi:PREDICTED: protein FAM136A [Nanorana parkeri]|uniref:protein FAM136A n=1 Tax=Nanorana parkeri TaxID=125878 RepID=UPI000854BBF3|nr:PREDICTED: protein FAM136A [Nanorana parkeri]